MKNCFDRTPHTMKDWLLLAAGLAATFMAALHGTVCVSKGSLLDIFTPQREDFLKK